MEVMERQKKKSVQQRLTIYMARLYHFCMVRAILQSLLIVLPIVYLVTFISNFTEYQNSLRNELKVSALQNNPPNRNNLLTDLPTTTMGCQWSKSDRKFVTIGSPEMLRAYPNKNLKKPFPNMNWGNVVVMIMTYNSESESLLIQKHVDSWISRMPKGLDVVFITDSTDERGYNEILPFADNVPPTIYLYKTPMTGEGAQARQKTVDSLRITYEKYKDRSDKEIFIKLDPDTYVIPENLIKAVNNVHKLTYPLPIDFGRVDCSKTRNEDCYSLGASYGLNKSGLMAIVKYIEENPKVFNHLLLENAKIIKNRMVDEDFFISHLFHEATCLPTVHISGISIRLYARNYDIRGPVENEWNETKHHITIHLVKEPKTFDMLDKFYYDENGKVKKQYRES